MRTRIMMSPSFGGDRILVGARGVPERHDDPALGIRWPLPVTNLSPRDRSHPLIDDQVGRAP